MRILGTSAPDSLIVLGDLEAAPAIDAELLQTQGVAQVLCIGGDLPSCPLPCSTLVVDEDAALLPSQLSSAAQSLRSAIAEMASQTALEALAPAETLVNDTAAGESSDEEGGSSQGIRLRFRASRSEEEKWGMKWHANIFKQSQRLMVDEVVEGSPIDRWNARQPLNRRIDYGDRLMRVNGVGAEEASLAKAAADMRKELQKLEIRALFWRPGAGRIQEENPKILVADRVSSKVLVCDAGGCLAKVAAVVMAHHLLDSPPSRASPSEILGDEAAAALKGHPALSAAVASLTHASSSAAEAGPPGRAEEEGAVLVDRDLTSPNDLQLSSQSPEDSLEIAEDPVEDDCVREPAWTYSCKKCRSALFHDIHISPHATDGAQKRSRRGWTGISEEGAGPDGVGENGGCTSIFMAPMKWMGDLSAETGKLMCGNSSCKQKLGGFSWHGLPCSCGQWQSPAFQVHLARVDRMPVACLTRGPAPEAFYAG